MWSKLATRLSVTYAAALLLLAAVHLIVPQRAGLLALTQVFAPHLFLPLAIALPLAWRRAPVFGRIVLAAALLVGLIRFGPGVVSLPAQRGEGTEMLSIVSWNLEAGGVSATFLGEQLLSQAAEVVAVQELRSLHVQALEADSALLQLYPHRLLRPEESVLGIGLISRYPLREVAWGHDPPFIAAELDHPLSGTISLVTAHPLPPQMNLIGGLVPLRYETERRDADLRVVRSLVEPSLRHADPLILAGDFNVTDREPGYFDLVAGLVDAHLSVGLGTGSTWRPARFDFLPMGVLRIDYVFTGGSVRPLSVGAHCPPNAGDHCLLHALLEVSQ